MQNKTLTQEPRLQHKSLGDAVARAEKQREKAAHMMTAGEPVQMLQNPKERLQWHLLGRLPDALHVHCRNNGRDYGNMVGHPGKRKT